MKNITIDGENTVITISKKRGRLVKNILLEIIMVCSFCVLGWNNFMCICSERSATLGIFFATVYLIAMVIAYSIFSDKWWNILGAVCMLLSAVGAVCILLLAAGAVNPPGSFNFPAIFVVMVFWGLNYLTTNERIYATVVLALCLAALFVMLRKYFSRAGGEKIAEN